MAKEDRHQGQRTDTQHRMTSVRLNQAAELSGTYHMMPHRALAGWACCMVVKAPRNPEVQAPLSA